MSQPGYQSYTSWLLTFAQYKKKFDRDHLISCLSSEPDFVGWVIGRDTHDLHCFVRVARSARFDLFTWRRWAESLLAPDCAINVEAVYKTPEKVIYYATKSECCPDVFNIPVKHLSLFYHLSRCALDRAGEWETFPEAFRNQMHLSAFSHVFGRSNRETSIRLYRRLCRDRKVEEASCLVSPVVTGEDVLSDIHVEDVTLIVSKGMHFDADGSLRPMLPNRGGLSQSTSSQTQALRQRTQQPTCAIRI